MATIVRHRLKTGASVKLEASMPEVLVDHLGDVQFEVKARGHRIYCDQPSESGGYDEGMSPPELLLASVGACAGYYAVQYLKSNRLPLEGLQIRVKAEKVARPARLDEFTIELLYPSEPSANHRAGVLESVRKCLIHNTLLNPPKIDVRIEASGAAAGIAA
jgi:putative redox protein